MVSPHQKRGAELGAVGVEVLGFGAADVIPVDHGCVRVAVGHGGDGLVHRLLPWPCLTGFDEHDPLHGSERAEERLELCDGEVAASLTRTDSPLSTIRPPVEKNRRCRVSGVTWW